MKNLGKRIKDNLLNNLKNMRLWEFGAMLLFIVNMAGIFYFNLSDLRLSLDPDFATVVYHLKEIVHKGTLILPNWVATTSMEFDSTLLFAIPLYAITNNAFLAVGLSDLLIVFIYITVIWSILRVLHVRMGIRFLTLAVIITPYNYDWLDYFKMLFFAHANYSIKALIPIMLVLCLMAFDDKFKSSFSKWKRYAFLGTYLFLLFVTSVSTGAYTYVCGVVPILFVRHLSFIKKGYGLKRGLSPVTPLSAIVSFVGLYIHKKIYTGSSPVTTLVKPEEFLENLREVFVGVFQSFGVLINGNEPAFSKLGLFYGLKILFVIALFIAAIVVMVKWLKNKNNYDYYILFFAVIIFNMAVLIVSDMRGSNDFIPYRYLFIGLPLLLAGVGIMLNRCVSRFGDRKFIPVMSVLLVAFAYILAGNFKETSDNMPEKDYIVEMTEYFDTLDVDTVFIADDRDTAVMCKAADDTKKYACYESEDESIYLERNYYTEEKDFDYYGEKNVIAIPNFNKLSDYVSEKIAGNYRYVGETRWLACYISDTNYFK